MSNPILFDIIDASLIDKFSDNFLSSYNNTEYFSQRSDILTNPDVFCENIRSKSQTYLRFDLFKKKSNAKYKVFPLPLELFEFKEIGYKIPSIIDNICTVFSDDIIIFYWNHDNDCSNYFTQLKSKNYKIINFGYTKIKNKNDITVPFFNINTKHYTEDKKYNCSFMGSPNNYLRLSLINSIKTYNNFFVNFGKSTEEEFLKITSSSIFTLCPRGGPNDGGFSYRFFECMHLNTIPIIFSDNLVYPYEDLDWNLLHIRYPENRITDLESIKNELEQIDTEKFLNYINANRKRFTLGGVQEEVYNALKDFKI